MWLGNFETLLSEVTTKWDGVIIITGDINIDLIGEQRESTKRYKNILHSFNLHQHITRLTRKGKSLIDHICTNVPKRYEPRYKYITDERKVDMNHYINYFSKLPLRLVNGFEEPEDQISVLNKLFSDCLESHAPTRRVKLTRPVAPWMKDPTIVSDSQKLELSRIKSRNSKNPKEHQKCLEDKKQYKKSAVIKKSQNRMKFY